MRCGARVLVAALLMALVGVGCSGDDDDRAAEVLSVVALTTPAAGSGPSESFVAVVEVQSETGAPQAGVEVAFAVERGGGDLADADGDMQVVVSTDGDGRASATWSTGIVPVLNRLTATVGDSAASFVTRVVLDTPFDSEEFGDIPEFLRESGYVTIDDDGDEVFLGSTEDLAFVADDRLLLGLSSGTSELEGALIEMDPSGGASLVELDGEPLVGTLGVAIDRDGVLWIADPRGNETGALLRVSRDGIVDTVATSTGGSDLIGPNYVAIGPDDAVYVSDPCLGVIFRYDPATDSVDSVLTTDVATQGGPNGLAFDASGQYLYFATESIALLCARPDLDLVDPVAGLFRTTVDGDGFGAIDPLAERRGLFGDGLAFDAEGNLYVIFDTQADFMLEESAVWVLPAGESELVKFLANGERVYANLAWGRGEFGETDLYVALLAVDAFNLPVRGVERVGLGIAGLPLLP